MVRTCTGPTYSAWAITVKASSGMKTAGGADPMHVSSSPAPDLAEEIASDLAVEVAPFVRFVAIAPAAVTFDEPVQSAEMLRKRSGARAATLNEPSAVRRGMPPSRALPPPRHRGHDPSTFGGVRSESEPAATTAPPHSSMMPTLSSKAHASCFVERRYAGTKTKRM